VGYSADRGDSVNLVSALHGQRCRTCRVADVEGPEIQAMAKSLGVPIALALFGALVLLGLVRPLLKGRNTSPGGQLNAIEAEALDRPALPAPAKDLSPTKEQERLDQAVIWPQNRSRWRTS
jgi:flagellar M-ring protein FliF